MGTQTMAEMKKKATSTIASLRYSLPQRRMAPAHYPDDMSPSAGPAGPGLGHDLRRVSIHPSISPVAQSCPIPSGPRVCPFGGACHTCPTQVHTKLAIGQPGDLYEQEADRVAERVMRMSAPPSDEETPGSPNPLGPALQCRCAECEEDEELLQEKRAPGQEPTASDRASCVPSNLSAVLHAPGEPLDLATRAFMEPRFGHDFSQVRVHSYTQAEESARALNALAYTVGRDVVFNAGQYAPGAEVGQRLIAHELAHVVQQTGRAPSIMRQCDPAWAGLPWSDRVTNAQGMGAGGARDQCVADMIDEALFPNITVHQSTNGSPSIDAAIIAGHYTEMGTLSDLHVNYDRNLNAKTGGANQYGETKYRTPAGTNSIQIYIILGPLALNAIGPDWTRMAFEHEQQHADDFLLQWATGTPHAATAGEELRIYQMNFEWHFLDFWEIDNTACTASFTNNFMPLFTYFASADAAARDDAFDSMRMFYEVRIEGIPCNLMKFKIWLQTIQNARPAADAYVARINTLPGLGLVRGTNPNTHFTCPSPCP